VADSREQKMSEFYRQCLEKGYTDMSDDKHSLKAKVIAMDLELDYKNIEKLFEEAKVIYAQAEAEKEQREKAEKQRIEHENTPGEWIMTFDFYGGYKEGAEWKTKLFRRDDGTLYYETTIKKLLGKNTGTTKTEGTPAIEVQNNVNASFKYHPSKTIFTGASSGGIAMGGFHQTEAYMSMENIQMTGKVAA